DVYQEVYDSVKDDHLVQLLKDMGGVNPVTVGSETFSITERYTGASKANFRKYWTAYFQSFGLTVAESAFPIMGAPEPEGHNLEAVLPGKVADSFVVIVHYDSIGPNGPDNPGVDDDMTGMATSLETARVLMNYPGRIHNTVRFVAADLEEGYHLAGA